MPITNPLKTARELQQAGLTPAVAEVLAEKFEEAAQATHDSLRDVIRQEFAALRSELNVKFAQIDARFTQIEGRFAQIDGKFAQLEGRMEGKFAQLEGRMEGRFGQLEGRMEGKFGEQEAKFERSLRTVTGLLLAAISLAVAIIKLFPNWH